MKRKLLVFLSLIIVTLFEVIWHPSSVRADDLNDKDSLQIEDQAPTKPVDPEQPGGSVDPGISPSTSGSLRIDFASPLNFGTVKLKKKNRIFPVLAQNFYNETGPRGNYIQISDRRKQKSGWTLQVKQNYQFRNKVIQEVENQELSGAVLSLGNCWANSITGNSAPTVVQNLVELKNIDQAYEVAAASSKDGQGIWTIAFGASKDNLVNQSCTLEPLLDQHQEPVMDVPYNKPAYTNFAIQLEIPERSKIFPLQYQTEITWILAELP